MDALAKLFGSPARVKILRLFLFNPDKVFDAEIISERAKVDKKIATKELTMLFKIGFIKKQTFQKTSSYKRGKQVITSTRNAQGFKANPGFPSFEGLHRLLIGNQLVAEQEIAKNLAAAGRLKVLVLSGVFVKDDDRPLDLLVVGDRIKQKVFDKAMCDLEAEIGRELRYAIFESGEFKYRLDMCDKLLRGVFDYPHSVVVNKTNLKFSR